MHNHHFYADDIMTGVACVAEYAYPSRTSGLISYWKEVHVVLTIFDVLLFLYMIMDSSMLIAVLSLGDITLRGTWGYYIAWYVGILHCVVRGDITLRGTFI